MNDQICRELLYREAFDHLSRVNELLVAARARHEEMAKLQEAV